MSHAPCGSTGQKASDQLAGLLTEGESVAFEDHLAGCDGCSSLTEQLRGTVAVLGSRRGRQVPRSSRAADASVDGRRAELLATQLPQLYEVANALHPSAADDLVQETVASALADKNAEVTRSGLRATLERLGAEGGPAIESPTIPAPGTDPDADTAELFYSDFYTDGPDAGAWINPPVAWGEARVLPPEDDLVTTEVYGVVDAALADLDQADVDLITLVDIEGAPFNQASLELGLPSSDARVRLARARYQVRGALDRYLRG